ncbi:hypothetical protein H0G86_005352 [Trichoderma simmonsii]|uniref:Uncharacterized protein n=1 Tax=Trichoderma simmonsii TaxID=1491479 RepID=A0A8G0LBH2_9HYPO|nr:hypothetical protein H0G86_005352 [Trichoderma simmonsii]
MLSISQHQSSILIAASSSSLSVPAQNRLMLPSTDEPSILHHDLLAKISRPLHSCLPPPSCFIFHKDVCAKLPAVRVFLELVYGPRVLDVFDSRVSIRRLWFSLFLFWFLSPPTVF